MLPHYRFVNKYTIHIEELYQKLISISEEEAKNNYEKRIILSDNRDRAINMRTRKPNQIRVTAVVNGSNFTYELTNHSELIEFCTLSHGKGMPMQLVLTNEKQRPFIGCEYRTSLKDETATERNSRDFAYKCELLTLVIKCFNINSSQVRINSNDYYGMLEIVLLISIENYSKDHYIKFKRFVGEQDNQLIKMNMIKELRENETEDLEGGYRLLSISIIEVDEDKYRTYGYAVQNDGSMVRQSVLDRYEYQAEKCKRILEAIHTNTMEFEFGINQMLANIKRDSDASKVIIIDSNRYIETQVQTPNSANMITKDLVGQTLSRSESFLGAVSGRMMLFDLHNKVKDENKQLMINVAMDNSHRSATGGSTGGFSSKKGKLFELLVNDVISKHYPSIYVGGRKHCGDIIVDDVLLIECKNYSKNVGNNEIEKFIRDIEGNKKIKAGLLLSTHRICKNKYNNKDYYKLSDGRMVYLMFIDISDNDNSKLFMDELIRNIFVAIGHGSIKDNKRTDHGADKTKIDVNSIIELWVKANDPMNRMVKDYTNACKSYIGQIASGNSNNVTGTKISTYVSKFYPTYKKSRSAQINDKKTTWVNMC
jgi:hypothetical protein